MFKAYYPRQAARWKHSNCFDKVSIKNVKVLTFRDIYSEVLLKGVLLIKKKNA